MDRAGFLKELCSPMRLSFKCANAHILDTTSPFILLPLDISRDVSEWFDMDMRWWLHHSCWKRDANYSVSVNLPDGRSMTAFTLCLQLNTRWWKTKRHHHLIGGIRVIKDLLYHLYTAAAWLTSQLSPFVFTWRLMVENTPTIITWTWYPSDQRSYMWKQYHLQLRIAQWITELWSFHGLLKGLSALKSCRISFQRAPTEFHWTYNFV